MIKTLFTTSWEDVLNMDILLKCNNEKHVIQVKSSEFENELESTILVYYNVYNNSESSKKLLLFFIMVKLY